MDIREALLDSWDRQNRIVNSVATRITEENRSLKPSPDGWPLYHQLAHIHLVRRFWLSQVDKELAESLPPSFTDGWQTPIQDLAAIKKMLADSGLAIRTAMEKTLDGPMEKTGFYENPVLFLQHMIWHEGWHVGLIFLGLRLGGQEPEEDWEEKHVWGEWRTEEW